VYNIKDFFPNSQLKHVGNVIAVVGIFVNQLCYTFSTLSQFLVFA